MIQSHFQEFEIYKLKLSSLPIFAEILSWDFPANSNSALKLNSTAIFSIAVNAVNMYKGVYQLTGAESGCL